MRQFGTFAEPGPRINMSTSLLLVLRERFSSLVSQVKISGWHLASSCFFFFTDTRSRTKKRHKQTLFASMDGVTTWAHSRRSPSPSCKFPPRGARLLQFPPHVHAGICNVTSKAKRAKFTSFLPCPLPALGVFSMTHNSVILWSFF